jgi:predicted enzyme related to lactoylglutathione lyase
VRRPAIGGQILLARADQDAAWTFYSGLFGWVKGERHDMGEMGPYQIYSRREGTTPIGGMFNKPEGMPSAWVLYIRVDSVEATAAKVAELGGQVVNGPMEVPGGDMVAQCLDPQGAFFAIHSTAA